ncbi:MAG: tRNA (guanosine(37)-N1)-methyltransferase TrmD [Candidatus Uhrbacteria bacterium]
MAKRSPLQIDIITIFPEMVMPYLSGSILGRGERSGALKFAVHQLRDWTHDKHNTVDDSPFGGGPGMVMKVEPFDEALKSLKIKNKKKTRVILTSAQGKVFTREDAKRLSEYSRLVFLCGRYEGVDERVAEHLADEELSIGDYILTGGELAALVMADAVSRHVPGVLGKQESLEEVHGSFPQYTRPEVYKKWKVPEVLLSGNHKKIEEWRREQQKKIP